MSAMLLWPVRFPWLTIVVSLALAILAAAGAARLEFSNDIRVFFSKDNPEVLAYDAVENTYSRNTSILFVVAPKDGRIFTRETLATIEQLTAAAWTLPYSRRVDSLTNFQRSYSQGDDLVVQDLVRDAASLTDAELETIRAVALKEPLLVDRLLSPKAHAAGINVPIVLPGLNPLEEQPEVVTAARKIAADAEAADPNVEIHLTGIVMINNAISEAGLHDMQTLVPVMLLIVLGLLAVQIRNVSGTAVTLLVIVLSIAAGMGAAGWAGILLSPPVTSAINIIMTLAVADAVHVLITFLHGVRSGQSRADAMIESLRVNAQPVLLTSVTTMLGFLSMNASESPPFRDLGNIVAGGVVAAWVLAMFLLPAMMMVLPMRVRPRAAAEEHDRTMQWLANAVISRRKPLLVGTGVLTLLLLAFIPRNEINDEFVKYFDEEMPFRVATNYTIENLTGFEFFEYSLESGEEGGINEPAYLNHVEAFANWYRKQPEVRHVYAITDIIKRLNMNMHADDPASYRIADNRELAAQYLLLYELSLPFGLDMNDMISVDRSATLMRVSLNAISTNGMLDLERRADAWLAENAPPAMRNKATGQSVMFAHIGSRNIAGLLVSSAIALVLISFLLVFAFRSVKFGLLSLLPNLAPAAMAFGLWGMLVGKVGLGLSVVVGMTIGIVVDDTIHFMSKYLRARREHGLSPQDGVRYAFDHVGRAMLVTSVVLVAGFGVLTLSDFELNSGMGLLCAVTIAAALLTDYFMLAPLLILVDEKTEAMHAKQKLGGAPREPA